MTEHIVAVFESETAAAAAASDLVAQGIPRSAIRQYSANGRDAVAASSTESTTTTHSGGGFWAWLRGEDTDSSTTRAAYPETASYDRRAQAGNAVLSVTLLDDSQIHTAVTILDSHHPLDVDESTEEADAGASDALQTGDRSGTTWSADRAALRSGTADHSASRREEIVPLSEEQVTIGKRMVDRGTTRVRRYVVERPVEEQVTLRGERVTVERRRPVSTDGRVGANAFEERVVEVHEREEEPVVEKRARVVEEVAIKREETERTETVHDSVRKEEVEISPDRQSPQR
jgi:uncharacterized protein (TIGR02271 family)